jgi:hypothetical protein
MQRYIHQPLVASQLDLLNNNKVLCIRMLINSLTTCSIKSSGGIYVKVIGMLLDESMCPLNPHPCLRKPGTQSRS